MGDVQLAWDQGSADLVIEDDDLSSADGFRTAIQLSLFTDRRAEPGDSIPAGDGDRRGWWADELAAIQGDKLGSRLWLLDRSSRREDLLRRAEEFDREALAWMLEDKTVSAIDIEVSLDGDALVHEIAIHRPGESKTSFRFSSVWEAVAGQTFSSLSLLEAPAPTVPPVDPGPAPTSPILYLVDSDLLFVPPDIDLADSLFVTPSSYATWTAAIAGFIASGKKNLLLGAGDYRSWGVLDRRNLMPSGGSAIDPNTIQYYGPDADLHPIDRVGTASEAIVDGILFSTSGVSNWMVRGLTFRGITAACQITEGAHHVVFDWCLWEYNANTYNMRIREAHDWTIQRGLIRNGTNGSGTFPPSANGDFIGIGIGNVPADIAAGKILDMEICNVGDGIQTTDSTGRPWASCNVAMHGNETYLTEEYLVGVGGIPGNTYTWCENGLDFKAGTDTAEGIYVKRHLIWGYRVNAGPTSRGEGINVQNSCRNVTFDGLIVDDCVYGLKDLNWNTTGTTITSIDTATDIFTVAAGHKLTDLQGPMNLTSTGTFPAEIPTNATKVWVIYLSATTFKLATSYANAVTDTAINLSTAGSGTIKIRQDADTPRAILIKNSDFSRIHDFNVADKGAVFKPITQIAYTDSYVSRCDYLTDLSPTVYHGPTFTGLTLSQVGAIQRPEDQTPPVPFDPLLNTALGTPAAGYERYERKRWTGPETAFRAKPWTP